MPVVGARIGPLLATGDDDTVRCRAGRSRSGSGMVAMVGEMFQPGGGRPV